MVDYTLDLIDSNYGEDEESVEAMPADANEDLEEEKVDKPVVEEKSDQ